MILNGPLFTVLVPTVGRPTLPRTLRSIRGQKGFAVEDIEILVVADGPQPQAEHQAWWAQAQYVETSCTRTWGHLNCQEALRSAHGQWLLRLDDDDIWTADALKSIYNGMRGLRGIRPMLFKFLTPERSVLWQRQVLEEGQIGTPCLVTPNVPDKLGQWTPRYEGDFDFIKSTLDLWSGGPAWREEIICITRPEPNEDWTS